MMKGFLSIAFPVVHWVDHSGKMHELSAVSFLPCPYVRLGYMSCLEEGDNDQQSEATTFENMWPYLFNVFLPSWCFLSYCKVYWQVKVAEIQVMAKLLHLPRQESEMLTQSPWSLLSKFICYSPSVTNHSGQNCGLRPPLSQIGTTHVHPNPNADKALVSN